MACATLKRSLDWENLNQHPTKRRRCSWQTTAPTATTTNNVQNSPSSSRSIVPSAFSDAQVSKISPEKMASDIRNEIKRLHKRKQLPFSTSETLMERMQESESSGSEMGNSPRRPESPPSIVRNPDKALFTFKQVQLICERMLKEREEEIREKYDDVLNTKLAEQYDAFVKFTYDQIQKRYDAAPSYLS